LMRHYNNNNNNNENYVLADGEIRIQYTQRPPLALVTLEREDSKLLVPTNSPPNQSINPTNNNFVPSIILNVSFHTEVFLNNISIYSHSIL
jgi:hypothetical protein